MSNTSKGNHLREFASPGEVSSGLSPQAGGFPVVRYKAGYGDLGGRQRVTAGLLQVLLGSFRGRLWERSQN